jgi:hypothetical protein
MFAVALLAALLAQPVPAQDAPKKAAPAKAGAKTRPNVMTRDELRACMNEQDRLQAIRTRIQQDSAELDRRKASVLASDEDLKKKAAALDPADEAGRKALEDEAVKHDQGVDAYNAKVAELRQQGQSYDTGRAAWAQKCADRNFDELDEAAIKKERAQAARAAKK